MPNTVTTQRLTRPESILARVAKLARSISSEAMWWCGDDLNQQPASGSWEWRDRLRGVVATHGGSGTFIENLNGRRSPVFSGAGYFRGAFPASISQPHTIIVIAEPFGSASGMLFDNNTGGGLYTYRYTDGRLYTANTAERGTTGVPGWPSVVRSVFNGTSSATFSNGGDIKQDTSGYVTAARPGITIGASRANSVFWTGKIAAVLVLPGAISTDKAAIEIADLLEDYYGISNPIVAQIRRTMREYFPTGYWWRGERASLTAWVDEMQGVSAAPGGTGTTLGRMGGKSVPSFNGSGYFRTGAFTANVNQALSLVVQQQRFGPDGTNAFIIDGISALNRDVLFHRAPSAGAVSFYSGNAVPSAIVTKLKSTIRGVFNSADSFLYLNSVQIASGHVGGQSLTGLTLGSGYDSANGLFGPIGDVLVLPGADANNAEAKRIAALIQQYYEYEDPRLQAIKRLMAQYFPTGYLFLGEDCTLQGWPDAIQGVIAAPGGSGTVMGTLGGRPAPVFNGSGYFRTASIPNSNQPLSILSISRRMGDVTSQRTIHDGVATNRLFLAHVAATGVGRIWAGYNNVDTLTALGTSTLVSRAVYNGVAASLYTQRSISASGNAGSYILDGITVGATKDSTGGFVGPIAAIAILPGATADNAVAIEIERLLQEYYKGSIIDNVRELATYGWLGETLPDDGPIPAWIDVVQGVVATAVGNPRATILNNRKAATTATAQFFRVPYGVVSIPSGPLGAVAVFDATNTASTDQFLVDIQIGRLVHAHAGVPTNTKLFTGTGWVGDAAPVVGQQIMTFTGSNSGIVVRRNGAQITTGVYTERAVSGLIGIFGGGEANSYGLQGKSASVVLTSGTGYAERALALEALFREHYTI